MRSPEDRFDFFKKKILCAINQIKERRLKVSTYSYNCFVYKSKWTVIGYAKIHPFGALLDETISRQCSNIRTSELVIKNIAKMLGIDRENVLSFAKGFKGTTATDLLADSDNYYVFGRELRLNLTGK